jgi:hypothetical protein
VDGRSSAWGAIASRSGAAQWQGVWAWLSKYSGLLGQMTHDGLIHIWAVPHCIGVGESIEGVAVACLDGIQPCLLDWKAYACVIEPNKSTHAGEIKVLGTKGVTGARVGNASVGRW